jgi:hypothetical protein
MIFEYPLTMAKLNPSFLGQVSRTAMERVYEQLRQRALQLDPKAEVLVVRDSGKYKVVIKSNSPDPAVAAALGELVAGL